MIEQYILYGYLFLIFLVGLVVVREFKLLAPYWIFLLFPLGFINEMLAILTPQIGRTAGQIYYIFTMMAYGQILVKHKTVKIQLPFQLVIIALASTSLWVLITYHNFIPLILLVGIFFVSSIWMSTTHLKKFQNPILLMATTTITATSGFEFINYNLFALTEEEEIKVMVKYFGYAFHYIFLIALLVIYGIYKNRKHVTD